MAGKRWLQQHAAAFAPHQVTLLGDDLYSKQPFGALALAQGFNFIVVCKPDSHPKFGHVADLHFTVSHRQPKLIAIDGHVADLHFTPMCAMRLTASEGERHGTHFRAVSPPVTATKSSKAARPKRVNNAISARTLTVLVIAFSVSFSTKDVPPRSKSRSWTCASMAEASAIRHGY